MGSSVSPSLFGCVVMGSIVLSISSPSCVLYSAGSGVSSVHVALSVLRSRLLSFVHLSMSCRYRCMLYVVMRQPRCLCSLSVQDGSEVVSWMRR